MKRNLCAGIIGCLVVLTISAPSSAEEINRDEVPPPEEVVGIWEDCIGIQVRGHSGHEVIPEIGTGGEAGISYNRLKLDAAYIEPDGIDYDDLGNPVKWWYKVTGKSSQVNCPSLAQAPSLCAESPTLALQWSSELLEWVQDGAGLGDLPPLPTCPDPN